LKDVHHIVASSAETVGAFKTGCDTVNLHGPTRVGVDDEDAPRGAAGLEVRHLGVPAQLEFGSKIEANLKPVYHMLISSA
jgi:hypothetical protein